MFRRLIDYPAWIGHCRRWINPVNGISIHENLLNVRGLGGYIGIHCGGALPICYLTFRQENTGEWMVGQINVIGALQDIGPGDGATTLIPGSHKSAMRHPKLLEQTYRSDDAAGNQFGMKELYLEAGDVLMLTDAITHGSAARTNDGYRRHHPVPLLAAIPAQPLPLRAERRAAGKPRRRTARHRPADPPALRPGPRPLARPISATSGRSQPFRLSLFFGFSIAPGRFRLPGGARQLPGLPRPPESGGFAHAHQRPCHADVISCGASSSYSSRGITWDPVPEVGVDLFGQVPATLRGDETGCKRQLLTDDVVAAVPFRIFREERISRVSWWTNKSAYVAVLLPQAKIPRRRCTACRETWRPEER